MAQPREPAKQSCFARLFEDQSVSRMGEICDGPCFGV